MIAVVIVLGYLLGSIPWGVIVGRLWHGVDLRSYGSGNTGFTNALRALGWGASTLVLLGDLGKGAAAVLLARGLVGTPTAEVAAALAAIAGHDWSVFLRFRGGKGVSTSFAGLAVLAPAVAGLSLVVFLVVAAVSRYVSLASLLGSGSVLAFMVGAYLLGWEPTTYLVYAGLGVPLIWWRHRDNIRRLLQGSERRLGRPAEALPRGGLVASRSAHRSGQRP